MKTKKFIGSLVILAFSFSAWSEDFTTDNEIITGFIKSKMNMDDYISIQKSIGEHCKTKKYFAEKSNMTIYERKKAIKEISACIKLAKASAVSLALSKNNINKKLAAEEAIKPKFYEIENEAEENQYETDFMGINFGLGFGYSFSENEAIDDAEIVDGIIRVNSNKKKQPRVLLEFHKYFWCNKSGKSGASGCGPFVAVAAKKDDVISGVGMGFMYGFKTKSSDSEGISIGVGAILDADVKDLADGFKENKPAPIGEKSVRYKSESRWSGIIFVTRTF